MKTEMAKLIGRNYFLHSYKVTKAINSNLISWVQKTFLKIRCAPSPPSIVAIYIWKLWPFPTENGESSTCLEASCESLCNDITETWFSWSIYRFIKMMAYPPPAGVSNVYATLYVSWILHVLLSAVSNLMKT